MTELLHLSALLPAAFGACCTVGGRRGSRVLSGFEGFAAVAMFVAMADVALGLGLVAPILWVAGLVALALVGLPLGRQVAPSSGSVLSSTAALAAAASAATMSVGIADSDRIATSGTRASPIAPEVDEHAGYAHRNGLHTSLGLIVMAGLLALMAAGHVASASSHHSTGWTLPALLLAGAAVYAGYSVWRAVTLYRLPLRNLIGCLEAASMAASVALMAGALVT